MPAIVGEWLGYHECERIRGLLVDHEEFLAEATEVCALGAPVEHTHFFTASGAFGSRDQDRNQVDEGWYRLTSPGRVTINDFEFGFQIVGDGLTLVPPEVDTSACADKLCRFMAVWVLMVAMPGTTWTRIA